MKTKKYLLIVFLSVCALFFYSCDNDDDAVAGQQTDSSEQDNSESGSITLYRVEGDRIVKKRDENVTGTNLEYQKDTKKHQQIWDLVKKIIPKEYMSKMSEFMIYSGEDSGSSGYVFETEKDLSKWQMGIAIDFAYEGGFNKDGELAYTIIHEFGHILSLEKEQVDSSINEESCKHYFPGEGCSKEDSYINTLYQNHWVDIWKEFNNVDPEKEEEAEKFYQKYKTRYVTQYASTNPGEDIAEVFATFVTSKAKPKGENGADKKVQRLYQKSELVKLRNYIRGNTQKSSERLLPIPGTWKNAKTIGDRNKSHCRLHKSR
ncbi:putative zinc-binding metallopeptidase [Aquimarina algicola]|nr:putative zinc-binding metallopeptidase [Aquimarina algicola]